MLSKKAIQTGQKKATNDMLELISQQVNKLMTNHLEHLFCEDCKGELSDEGMLQLEEKNPKGKIKNYIDKALKNLENIKKKKEEIESQLKALKGDVDLAGVQQQEQFEQIKGACKKVEEKITTKEDFIKQLQESANVKVEGNKNTNISGKFKFSTSEFAVNVFNLMLPDTKNILKENYNHSIGEKFKQITTELNTAKKDFFEKNIKNSNEDIIYFRFFDELDRGLVLDEISYDKSNIQKLREKIENKVKEITGKSQYSQLSNNSNNLVNAYTNWHLGLFAIGAQHCPSSSAGKDTNERRSKIIKHLHDEDWWKKAKEAPMPLEDSTVEIKVSLDEDGRKRLIIPTANDIKDAGEMTEVINRTIDELSNVNVINWKNVSKKDGKFAKYAESMCLARWKGVAFDGIESPLSEIMPKEKGDWYNWVSKAFALKSPFLGVDDYYVTNLIQNVIGENKDILMEFLSNIIAHINDNDLKFNEIIKLLTSGQVKLIISSYQALCAENQVEHVKIKAILEVEILVNKLQGNDSVPELKNGLSELLEPKKQNTQICKV